MEGINIHDQILFTLPVFQVTDTLDAVITFFEETTFSHVAVTEDEVFLGLLSENDLGCFQPETSIESFRYQLETFSVSNETLWLDVLEEFAKNDANLLPVLDDVGRVTGYYDLNAIVALFIATPFFTEPGGILIISKGIKDYSMSEISQIVESNNSRLLGAFITDNQNDLIQVTLKVNGTNLNEVIQTFRRYGYTILSGTNDDQFMQDLKERSDYLDKYLNV
ncbi:MAG: acetoin utilization protein acuB [Bacteroidota bacterium]